MLAKMLCSPVGSSFSKVHCYATARSKPVAVHRRISRLRRRTASELCLSVHDWSHCGLILVVLRSAWATAINACLSATITVIAMMPLVLSMFWLDFLPAVLAGCCWRCRDSSHLNSIGGSSSSSSTGSIKGISKGSGGNRKSGRSRNKGLWLLHEPRGHFRDLSPYILGKRQSLDHLIQLVNS